MTVKKTSYTSACVAHAIAAKDAEIEALRAEVGRLQDIVKPRREDDCLTIDHWRARAYDLEVSWGRASRAANSEATARKEAEARAERLAEALRDLLALPVAEEELRRLDKGIGTATRSAAWLRARAAIHLTATQENE